MEIKPSQAVQSSKWSEMTMEQLLEQRKILTDRYDFMLDANPDAAEQIAIGLGQLEVLIKDKT